MARPIDYELEKARVKFCSTCPYKPDCVDCLESGHRPTRVKALKRALSLGIPESLARDMVIGGKNICLN